MTDAMMVLVPVEPTGKDEKGTRPELGPNGEDLAEVMRDEFPDENDRRKAWGLLFRMVAERDAAGES